MLLNDPKSHLPFSFQFSKPAEDPKPAWPASDHANFSNHSGKYLPQYLLCKKIKSQPNSELGEIQTWFDSFNFKQDCFVPACLNWIGATVILPQYLN